MFGGASIYFDGSGDYLTCAGADFGFGTGDFVIEARVRVDTHSGWACFINFRNGGAGNMFFGLNQSNVRPVLHQGGVNRILAASDLSLDTWYHVAIVRSSGVSRLFIDGVQSSSDYTDSNNYSAPTDVQFGSEAGGNPFNGWLDEVRIRKGTDGGWFSGFSVPGSPY